MYSNFTEEEFKEFWGDLVRENGLENNPWVTKTYENKELWATAYLRDDFFGEIFQEVKEEIMKGVALSIEEKQVKYDLRIMNLTKYLEEGVYEILYVEWISAVQCLCKKFESRECAEHIPECLIMPHWTNKAKIGFLNVDYCWEVYSKFMEIAQYAKLRVHYGPKKGRYVVSIFEEGHNHELTLSSVVHLHPVSRKISEADKAQIDGLQSHGIRTCHVMGYMVAQKGGYLGVGFTKKDLYNYFDKKMCVVIKDGDIYAALNYLNVKSSTDPHSFGVYFSTDDGRLKCPFWADGTSRSDYFCFGDVVAFNTMYKKNKYKYLLVILSGCNHHSCNT
ncbi:hypothetical protein MTR_7g446510 [Medicago truncatula]|uniref:Uncharacterized protein n=1 Tax=Medicago truncatula TaxID=3880 RepID=A0A072U9C2_MEDTR|nr:hypothetical protein MTR_7g446510 [Medicago truncatula]